MTALFELIDGVIELWCSWRFYLCLAIAVGGAVLLHRSTADAVWVWFISVPLVVVGLVAGWWWQRSADRERS